MYRLADLLPITCCLFFSLSLQAQNRLTGRVIDDSDGAGIPFATVYFDGTTVGTTSEEDGSFSLPLSDIDLPAIMVATHLSYRPEQLVVEGADAAPAFRLTPAANEIAAVEVGDRNNRAKNLAEFREQYLGTDDWARRARIENEERLRFDRTYATDTLRNADILVERYGLPEDLRKVAWAIDGKSLTFEQATDLQASSAGPLRVDLPDLGYRLTADLIRFVTRYRAQSTEILGTYYFQPYEGEGKARRKHARNRQQAYYNSSQHFLRALYDGTLDEQGYAVYEKVDGAVRPLALQDYVKPAGPAEKAIRGLEGREIVILYFFDGRGQPLPPGKRKNRAYDTSYLYLTGEAARFRSDGTTGDVPLRFGGSLGQLTVTRMLPSDYLPEK